MRGFVEPRLYLDQNHFQQGFSVLCIGVTFFLVGELDLIVVDDQEVAPPPTPHPNSSPNATGAVRAIPRRGKRGWRELLFILKQG